MTMAEQEIDERYPEELPGEDWRPLDPPYEDYLVSNCGRVWRVSRGVPIATYPGAPTRGENRLVFKVPTMATMNGAPYRQTARTLAREVMTRFGPPGPTDKKYAAQCIDGDETNCHISNLEWGPPKKGSRT